MTLTDISNEFTDEDDVDKIADDSGIFNYKVQYKPDELLVKTVRGFLRDDTTTTVAELAADFPIDIVVLKPFTEEFSIELYAYDGDNDQSDNPVVVKFSASTGTPVNPRTGTYAVKQKEKWWTSRRCGSVTD